MLSDYIIEVLLLVDPIDEYAVAQLKEYKGKKPVRVSKRKLIRIKAGAGGEGEVVTQQGKKILLRMRNAISDGVKYPPASKEWLDHQEAAQ
ncbi:hypothetical protein BD769DRAFT_1676970 [Suillus cothurnatus]|nr:hypothetical protein BD769DRAFT_1676970 [Suillus cothurnatus]